MSWCQYRIQTDSTKPNLRTMTTELNTKKSFIYNDIIYYYPTRFTSDSEADAKHRIKYQRIFKRYYDGLKEVGGFDEKSLEELSRCFAAKEPHFTGFDGDGYKNPNQH